MKEGLIVSLKTLGLACLGTSAIVGAHHLGRKQNNPDARLIDYVDGVITTFLNFKKSQSKSHQKHPTASKECLSPNLPDLPELSDLETDVESGMPDVNASLHANQGLSVENRSPQWISGVADLNTNKFAVVAINSDRQIIWQTPMPERVHDILIQPISQAYNHDNTPATDDSSYTLSNQAQSSNSDSPHITVMGRRPSETFWVLDTITGRVIHTIKAQFNRHFYGHACYSLDGNLLYVTENNTATFAGVVGVYDVRNAYNKIAEFETHGIGPHELVMHPDGKTLVIANGGIKTEKASREELNLDSMQPSLVYLNCHDGSLLEQVYPTHNQMSVRHLAMHDNGTVIIGIQFQGERHLSVPLVLTHQRGESELTPLQINKSDTKGWHRFHHYIASVVVNSEQNMVCVTSPIGGCAAVFDLETFQMIDAVELADCAGAAIWPALSSHKNLAHTDGVAHSFYQINKYNNSSEQLSTEQTTRFLVSDGQGYLSQLELISIENQKSVNLQKEHLPYAFDNHLNAVMSETA